MESEKDVCPIYIQAINNMILKRSQAKTDDEKLHICLNFAEKYTMLADDWFKLLLSINNQSMMLEVKKSDQYYHLYPCSDEQKKHAGLLHTDVLYPLSRHNPSEYDFKEVEKYLNFPHVTLYSVYRAYIDRYPKPYSKEIKMKYQKNKELYDKIKDCEEDIEEWAKCLNEIEDKEAAIANFEDKLERGKNWANQKLWEAYFKFLNDNNLKEILDVYRKYTRLFISDKKAAEEYREEIEKFSSWNVPTTNYWIDTIKYEMDFGTLEFAYVLLQRVVKAVHGKNVDFEGVQSKDDLIDKLKMYSKEMEIMRNDLNYNQQSTDKTSSKCEQPESPRKRIFFTNNPVKQVLPFRQSFIHHILKTANGYILKKLYATCKLFFSLQPAPLCYRLEISRRYKNEIWEETLSLGYDALSCTVTPALDNLHVYEKLYVENTGNFKLLSTIIQKLYRCDVFKIHISRQDLTLSDYKFMISKNIREIYFDLVYFYDGEKQVAGNHLFELANVNKKLEFFELLNSQDLYIFSTDKEFRRLLLLHSALEYEKIEFQRIYLEGQDLNVNELLHFINNTVLKAVTFQDVLIKDESENLMSKKALKEFVEANVAFDTLVNVE